MHLCDHSADVCQRVMILARTALSLALAAFWLCPSSALVPSSQLFRWQASTPAGGRNMECKPVRRPRHTTCTTERVECPTGNSARLGSRNYRNPAADGNVDLRPTKGLLLFYERCLFVQPSWSTRVSPCTLLLNSYNAHGRCNQARAHGASVSIPEAKTAHSARASDIDRSSRRRSSCQRNAW